MSWWGKTYDAHGGSDSGSGGCWLLRIPGGTVGQDFPNPKCTGFKFAMDFGTPDMRVAVYDGGGVSSTDPEGLAIVKQAAVTSEGSGWTNENWAAEDIDVSEDIWLVIKWGGGGGALYFDTTDAEAEDFDATNGRFISDETSDATVAFDSTWPADGGTQDDNRYYVAAEIVDDSQIRYGKDADPAGGTAASFNMCALMVIPASTVGGGYTQAQTCGARFYTHASVNGDARLAVYSGGTSDTDPEDMDLIASAAIDFVWHEGWVSVRWPPVNIDVTKRIWIAIKADSAMNIMHDVLSSEREDFSTDGRYASVAVTSDPTIAWVDPWPADTGSNADVWFYAEVELMEGAVPAAVKFIAPAL